MSIKTNTGGSIDATLLGILLRPSFSSGLLAAATGISVVAIPFMIVHIGNFTRQDLIGLHTAYSQTPFAASANAAGAQLSQNIFLNNALLFVMWGSVGLVVYLIVQGLLNGLKNADNMVHEFGYVHADWKKIVASTLWRAVVRLSALAAWWVVVRFFIFWLAPTAWSFSRHATENGTHAADWQRSLVTAGLCVLLLHILAILLRLVFLRPRLFGSVIV